MVTGGVTNEGGVVSAGSSPGTLTIDGDLSLEAGSILLEVGKDDTDTIVHDALSVSGIAEVGGLLQVALDLSEPLDAFFDPTAEDPFRIDFLTASAVVGVFADVLGRDLGDEKVWGLRYFDDRISLSVEDAGFEDLDLRSFTLAAIPEPGTSLLLGLGLGGIAVTRRRGRAGAHRSGPSRLP